MNVRFLSYAAKPGFHIYYVKILVEVRQFAA